MPIPGYDPAVCNLFVDDCDKRLSTEQLLRAMITVDENGCPVFKTASISLASPSVTQTPGLIRATAAGSIAAGSKSVTVENVGGSIGKVLGIDILPDEKVTFNASGESAVLGEVSYDGSTTTLVISTVV